MKTPFVVIFFGILLGMLLFESVAYNVERTYNPPLIRTKQPN